MAWRLDVVICNMASDEFVYSGDSLLRHRHGHIDSPHFFHLAPSFRLVIVLYQLVIGISVFLLIRIVQRLWVGCLLVEWPKCFRHINIR